jgi:hypothetical protein
MRRGFLVGFAIVTTALLNIGCDSSTPPPPADATKQGNIPLKPDLKPNPKFKKGVELPSLRR